MYEREDEEKEENLDEKVSALMTKREGNGRSLVEQVCYFCECVAKLTAMKAD